MSPNFYVGVSDLCVTLEGLPYRTANVPSPGFKLWKEDIYWELKELQFEIWLKPKR